MARAASFANVDYEGLRAARAAQQEPTWARDFRIAEEREAERRGRDLPPSQAAEFWAAVDASRARRGDAPLQPPPPAVAAEIPFVSPVFTAPPGQPGVVVIPHREGLAALETHRAQASATAPATEYYDLPNGSRFGRADGGYYVPGAEPAPPAANGGMDWTPLLLVGGFALAVLVLVRSRG